VLAKSRLLAGIQNLLGLIWLGGLVVIIGQGKRWIEKRSLQLWLSRVSGMILIVLGVRLVLEERQIWAVIIVDGSQFLA
jgi:threonine/homoserine/homoserine lactone efflux protein